MSGSSTIGIAATSSGTGITTGPPAITFSLSPGSLNAGQILDLISKVGINVYNKAIESVKISFDSNCKNINLLQNQLSSKYAIAGWDIGGADILTIADAKGDMENLLTEYGCLT